MKIEPYVGVDGIHFGMDQFEVRALLPGSPEVFKRTETSEWPCDYYPDLGLFVYYKQLGVVEAIELCVPASAELGAEDFLKLPAATVITLLKQADERLEVSEDSFTSYRMGIGGYVPDMEENGARAESIIVFERGYYSGSQIKGDGVSHP